MFLFFSIDGAVNSVFDSVFLDLFLKTCSFLGQAIFSEHPVKYKDVQVGKNVIVGGFMRIEAKFWTSIELIHT